MLGAESKSKLEDIYLPFKPKRRTKAMIARELPPPPIAQLMQFDLIEAEPGKVVFTCRPDESVFNPNGASTAAWCARCSIRSPGWRCTARCPPARDTRPSRSR